MNSRADKFQEQKSRLAGHAGSQKHDGGEATVRFVDNRTEVIAQRKLQEMAHTYSAQQQPIQKTMDKSVIQLMPKIKGVEAKEISGLVLGYIQEKYKLELEQARQVLGKRKLLSLGGEFESIKDFVDQKLSDDEVTSYFKAREGSLASAELGTATEEITASIIGGKVNRGKGGRDVEWRLIERSRLDEIKKELHGKLPDATDQGIFENWPVAMAFDSSLSKILSTPVDAYSSDTLALAGGQSKFLNGTTKLTPMADYRVRQLIQLCSLLGYKPLLVFNAAVSCEQAQAVADAYGVDVTHLGVGHH